MKPPIAGIRVLDCSTILAGPLTCQILGDFGADVIKIEHPDRPDPMRGHGVSMDEHGLWWKEIARNKRTVGLHLGKPEGAEVFLELVREADVVVENFRPGTLERWGLAWKALKEVNPRLVLLRVTGFGQEGPYAARPAFGTLVEAMSGFAHLTGQPEGPPTLPPFGLADTIAGISGANAVMMALYHRDARSGEGQVIDLSLLEPMMLAVGPAPTAFHKLGVEQSRQGNRSGNNAPRNLYRSLDGRWVAVSSSADAVARRIMELVGRAELAEQPWFATGAGRADHADELDDVVGGWIEKRSADEVIAAFDEAGAAAALVYTPRDLVQDVQVRARQMLLEIDDPDLGPLLQHNVLFRMSETPGSVRHTGRAPGEDTEDVLIGELGFDADQVRSLRQRGVVR